MLLATKSKYNYEREEQRLHLFSPMSNTRGALWSSVFLLTKAKMCCQRHLFVCLFVLFWWIGNGIKTGQSLTQVLMNVKWEPICYWGASNQRLDLPFNTCLIPLTPKSFVIESRIFLFLRLNYRSLCSHVQSQFVFDNEWNAKNYKTIISNPLVPFSDASGSMERQWIQEREMVKMLKWFSTLPLFETINYFSSACKEKWLIQITVYSHTTCNKNCFSKLNNTMWTTVGLVYYFFKQFSSELFCWISVFSFHF